MQPRLDHRKAAPAAFRGLDETRRYLDGCGLDRKLRLLVEIRVSQINGCVYCVDKHVEEARAAVETRNASIACASGRKLPSSTQASAQRWHGPRR